MTFKNDLILLNYNIKKNQTKQLFKVKIIK